jgi:hypothetical protein
VVVHGVEQLGTRRRAKEGSSERRCGEAEEGVRFIGPGRRWGGGEATGSGGVLLLVGFEGVKREE